MNRTKRVYSKVEMVWSDTLQRYATDYDISVWIDVPIDSPTELCCGASDEQKDIEKKQAAYYDTMTTQANAVFAQATSVMNDLKAVFEPIIAKGPTQEGYSAAEMQNFQGQITEQTGAAYKKASTALNSELAAQGGGDVPIISGASNQLRAGLASSEAAQEASERQNLTSEDYAVGRDNFNRATASLSAATGTYNPATSMAGAATGAGSAAATTANEITQANNSWVSAVTGMAGGIMGGVATGGMSNLGKGAGFFGGNSPAPGSSGSSTSQG